MQLSRPERDRVPDKGEHPRLGRGRDNHDKCMEYAKMADILIDDADGVEAEFSMLKCQIIEDGTYQLPCLNKRYKVLIETRAIGGEEREEREHLRRRTINTLL